MICNALIAKLNKQASLGCEKMHQQSFPYAQNYLKNCLEESFPHKGFAVSNLLGSPSHDLQHTHLLMVHDELSYDNSIRPLLISTVVATGFKNQVFTDKNMVSPLAKSLGAGYSNLKYAVR